MQSHATETLGGGAAVGAALAVLFTHGADYTTAEVSALAAGMGVVVAYLARLLERILLNIERE